MDGAGADSRDPAPREPPADRPSRAEGLPADEPGSVPPASMESLATPRDALQYRARGRPTVFLDQGRILAAQEEQIVLQELGLDRLECALEFGEDRGGVLVRDAGPRRTWRVEHAGAVYYVKVHKAVPWRQRLRFLGNVHSPARVEWDNLRALRRAGFDVPEPVAVGEESAGIGFPQRSFLVTREVPGRPLDAVLAEGWPDPHQRGTRRARDAVLRDVAGMIRRFHANGFIHKDLYLGHLIVAPDPRWGRPYFIDLQRVEQRFPPRRRWLVKDLAALLLSAPSSVSRSDKLRFLLTYLCKTRLDPLARRWARDILAKSERMSRHRPRYG